MASFDGSGTNGMADLEAATVSGIAQSMFPGAAPTRAQLARSLWAVGSFTLLVGMTTAFHLPPAGPILVPAVYYLILAVVLAAAAVEMATAVFLHVPAHPPDDPRLHAFARRLLPLAYLVLLVAVSASGFVIPFKLPK